MYAPHIVSRVYLLDDFHKEVALENLSKIWTMSIMLPAALL